MTPIRILFVSAFSEANLGGQINLLRLVRRLPRERFASIVLIPGDGAVARHAEAAGADVEILGCRSEWKNTGLARGRWALQLRSLVRRHRPSVVYVDEYRRIFPAWAASRGTGTALLWHVQLSLGFRRDPLYLRLVDAAVACSEAVVERFENSDVSTPRHVIPNAVDCDKYHPGEAVAIRESLGASNPGATMLLYSGELVHHKGVEDLLAALARLRDSPRRYRLWIAGEGTPEFGRALERQARRLGISESIEWLGYRDDVAELLRAADIYVHPSHTEGMSLSLLESMASGCAVVASDIAANREVVTPETGCLAPARDPAKLAATIDGLARSPARMRRQGEAARQRAFDHFGVDRFVSRFAAVLAALGGGRDAEGATERPDPEP